MANGQGGQEKARDDPRGRRTRTRWPKKRLARLVETQLDNAEGIRHLMMHDPKSGQFVRVTGNAEQIGEALKTDNAIWFYTKDPSVRAFTDLLNRALDKPAEHVQVAGADGGPLVIRWQRDEKLNLELDSTVTNVPACDVKQIESHDDAT